MRLQMELTWEEVIDSGKYRLDLRFLPTIPHEMLWSCDLVHLTSQSRYRGSGPTEQDAKDRALASVNAPK